MRPVKTGFVASVLALTTSTAAMAQSHYDDQQSRRRDAGGWLHRTRDAADLCDDARRRDAAALALRRLNCAGAQNTGQHVAKSFVASRRRMPRSPRS